MKINATRGVGSVLLSGVIVMAGSLTGRAEDAKPAASPEVRKETDKTSGTAADGKVSINVTVAGPDGKPVTHSVGNVVKGAGGNSVEVQGSAIAVSSAGGKQTVTVTTVGPDGKVHTVTSDGKDGKLPPITLPTPDGKGMVMGIHPAPAKLERVTYAGVHAEEVPEVVSKHLPVPKGMGLVVTEVVPGSPAEKAGIKKDDILLRFDDQMLATQEQLRKLTRSKKSGEKVRFGLMQGGKETSLEVVLGEREEDVANLGHGAWQPFGWMKEGGGTGANHFREAAARAKEQAARVTEEARKQIREKMERVAGDRPPGPGPEFVERLEREVQRLREEVEQLRRGGRVERDGDRPPGAPRDGERPPGIRRERDGERPPGAARDGERPPAAPRDGNRP